MGWAFWCALWSTVTMIGSGVCLGRARQAARQARQAAAVAKMWAGVEMQRRTGTARVVNGRVV